MPNKMTLKNFDVKFNALCTYVDQYGGFPNKHEDERLYGWMGAMRNLHKKQLLRDEYVERLDGIGFIWNKREDNWFSKAEAVREYVSLNHCAPKGSTGGLHPWLKGNLDLLAQGELSEDKKAVMMEIALQINEVKCLAISGKKITVGGKELKWGRKYEELVAFRQVYPERWPFSGSKDPNEKKLGIWCQDLRARARKGMLEQVWYNKLALIGFNFEAKLDNWMVRFRKFEKAYTAGQELPEKLSHWARYQYSKFERLGDQQQRLLKSLGDPFPRNDFMQRLKECAEAIRANGEITKKSHPKLYLWKQKQCHAFRRNELDQEQVQALEAAGIKLSESKSKDDKWEEHYQNLAAFREANPDRWPSAYKGEDEKKMYIWCQAQRQAFAGTAVKRKPLQAERVARLNAIGFHWTAQVRRDAGWEERYEKLVQILSFGGSGAISQYANPNLYHWLQRQKRQYYLGVLADEKAQKLVQLGVVSGNRAA